MFAIFLFIACQSSDTDSAKSAELKAPQATQTAARKLPLDFIFDTHTLGSVTLDCESGQYPAELRPVTTRICEYGVCEQGEDIVMARFANYPNERCSVTIEELDIQIGPFVADVTPFYEDTKQFDTALVATCQIHPYEGDMECLCMLSKWC